MFGVRCLAFFVVINLKFQNKIKLNNLVSSISIIFIFGLLIWGPSKFNRKSDWPEKVGKRTEPDISKFAISVWVCSMSHFLPLFLGLRFYGLLWSIYILPCPPRLYFCKWFFFETLTCSLHTTKNPHFCYCW